MKFKGDKEFKILNKFFKDFDYDITIKQVYKNFSYCNNKFFDIVTFGKGMPIYIPEEFFDKKFKVVKVGGYGIKTLENVVKGNVVISYNKFPIVVPYFRVESKEEENFLFEYFEKYPEMVEYVVKQNQALLKVLSDKTIKIMIDIFINNYLLLYL